MTGQDTDGAVNRGLAGMVGDEQVYKKDLEDLYDYIMQPGNGSSSGTGAAANGDKPKKKNKK